jgi:hypothetical protein
VLTLTPESVKEENCKSKSSRNTTFSKPDNFRCSLSKTISNTSLERKDSDLSNAILFESIAGLVVELQRIKQGKPSRDLTCLKPNNFRFNTSIETKSISLERKHLNLSNTIFLVSIDVLVVELLQIEKGTLKITNRSRAAIGLV